MSASPGLKSALSALFHPGMKFSIASFGRLQALAALSLLVAFATCLPPRARAGEYLVFFGTYTGAKSKGIYASRFDSDTGKLAAPVLAAETPNPSFLAIDSRNRFLYAVNEIGNYAGKPAGSVSAFGLDSRTGRLTYLNSQSSGGADPCHLFVDKTGRNVLVANYTGGSVAVLPLAKDGLLLPASSFLQHRGSSVNKSRQEGPHAHGIYLDSRNRFAYVPDLGQDRYFIYQFNARKGLLDPNEPAYASVTPGSGPRHFAIHPGGTYAYGINEIACTVTSFARDKKSGALSAIGSISTLPPGEPLKDGFSTAELFCHPSGKYLYGSNRGHDTIVVFAIDRKTGRLAYVENASTGGKTPRSFGIDPSGQWLLAANQSSDNVVVFRIDLVSGRLLPTGQSIEVGAPVSVSFVPARK